MYDMYISRIQGQVINWDWGDTYQSNHDMISGTYRKEEKFVAALNCG